MIKATKESTTLKFVLASWMILNYMWISGRAEATLTEYGIAVTAILGIWVAREWKETHYAPK
jgi:hypothetical protein